MMAATTPPLEDSSRHPVRRILQAVCHNRGVHGAVFLSVARLEGTPRVTDVFSCGMAATSGLIGKALSGLKWSFESLLPLDQVRMFSGPEYAGELLGGMISFQGRVLGRLGLIASDTPRMRSAFTQTSSRLRLELGQDVVELSQGALLLVDPSGRIDMTCSRAAAWLKHPRLLSAIQECILQHPDSIEHTRLFVSPGTVLEIHRLHGTQSRYLVRISAATPLRVPRLSCLTKSQLQVAGFAAAGATSAEIARSLGRSLETVRSHLKATYFRLDIASRAELASLFATPWAE
ncbi:MAG: DNA-binding CsgD family transcriptional regulator [Myxococcota bacterium]|jgi:DNA-binding CsgD family transcriptional regulator